MATRIHCDETSRHRCFLLAFLRRSLRQTHRCNEVRLLSRRIIIRLFDDVKKKVQKNLRARTNRSNSREHSDHDTIDTLSHHDARTPDEVPSRVCFDGRRTPHHVTAQRLSTPGARVFKQHAPRACPRRHRDASHVQALTGNPHEHWLSDARTNVRWQARALPSRRASAAIGDHAPVRLHGARNHCDRLIARWSRRCVGRRRVRRSDSCASTTKE